MTESPGVQRREILLPSLDTVDRHSVHGIPTTCYYDCVRVGDGAGIPVINKVTE